jgi:hypothetical protein
MKEIHIGSIFVISNMDKEELLDFDFSIEVEEMEDEDLDTIKKEIAIYEQDLINNYIE